MCHVHGDETSSGTALRATGKGFHPRLWTHVFSRFQLPVHSQEIAKLAFVMDEASQSRTMLNSNELEPYTSQTCLLFMISLCLNSFHRIVSHSTLLSISHWMNHFELTLHVDHVSINTYITTSRGGHTTIWMTWPLAFSQASPPLDPLSQPSSWFDSYSFAAWRPLPITPMHSGEKK